MMKNIFLMLGLALGLSVHAQVQTPPLSPGAQIKQTVGLTDFELNYSRPSLRGRSLFQQIIPLKQAWRFGANKNTTLSFDTPINIGGKDLKAGTYALFAVPDKDQWEIIFYNDHDNWGMPQKLDDSKIAATILTPVIKNTKKVETFTISFEDLNLNGFNLHVAWENTLLSIPVTLPTRELALNSINRTLNPKPSARDYYSSAGFLLNENIQLDKALEYINKAMELDKDPVYYQIYNKALILKGLGKKQEAIQAAQLSIEKAKKAGNDEYVRKNTALIEELK